MSTIEFSPQRQKEFKPRTQDHGDAASRRGHEGSFRDPWEIKGAVQKDKEHLVAAFEDTYDGVELMTSEDIASMSPSQLEGEANKILRRAFTSESDEFKAPEPPSMLEEEEPDVVVDFDQDGFLTEADFDIKSKHEIARLMARRVTLDPDFDRYDDTGDSDYTSHIHIRRQL
ncbi:MAG: hypothetical protein ACOH18_03955 [Candidatus Saccharimonadaceae bacterium]